MAHSSKSYLVILSLAALALFGLGPQEPAKEQITLKLNPKVGERFELVVSVESRYDEKSTLNGKLVFADRVLEVGSDRYKARHYFADVKYTGTGRMAEAVNTMEFVKGTQSIHEITLRGLLISVDDVSSPAPINFDLILPPNPVSVGDTWTEKLRLAPNGAEFPVVFKLESFSETEATISATPSETPGYKFDGPFKYVVHRPSGKAISGEGQFTIFYGGVAVETKMKTQLTSPDYRKKN